MLNWYRIGALLFCIIVWALILIAFYWMPVAYSVGVMAVMFVSLLMIARR